MGRSICQMQSRCEIAAPKTPCEARSRPPRGRAWLRGRMVSHSQADFDLRENQPPSRNTLLTREIGTRVHGTADEPDDHLTVGGYRSRQFQSAGTKVEAGHLNYPAPVRDTAKSGMGRMYNRHLSYLVESVSGNVGDARQDAKPSSPAMPAVRVGAAIVVGGVATTRGERESRSQGEGPQSVGTSHCKRSRMPTRRNLR